VLFDANGPAREIEDFAFAKHRALPELERNAFLDDRMIATVRVHHANGFFADLAAND
jgi:hypothetical protein